MVILYKDAEIILNMDIVAAKKKNLYPMFMSKKANKLYLKEQSEIASIFLPR